MTYRNLRHQQYSKTFEANVQNFTWIIATDTTFLLWLIALAGLLLLLLLLLALLLLLLLLALLYISHCCSQGSSVRLGGTFSFKRYSSPCNRRLTCHSAYLQETMSWGLEYFLWIDRAFLQFREVGYLSFLNLSTIQKGNNKSHKPVAK